MLEYAGTTQHPTRNPGPRRSLPHPDKVLAPLTCRRKRSASAALPAAMHWKEAFWPALTSTSPRREKCGAFAVGIEPPCELGLCPPQAEATATIPLTLYPHGLGLTAGVAEKQDVI